MKKIIILSLFALFLAGCSNYFGFMHTKGTSSNVESLIADARSSMSKGEYNNAVSYYAKAMEIDSKKSRARYGHSVAYIKSIGFDIVTLAKRLNGTGVSASDYINPLDFGLKTLGELETFVDTLITDLEPIIRGTCDNEIRAVDSEVNMAMSISKLIKAGVKIKNLIGNNYSIRKNADGSFTILKDGVEGKFPTAQEAQEILDLISGNEGAIEAFQTSLENSGVDVTAEGFSDVNDVLDEMQKALLNAKP